MALEIKVPTVGESITEVLIGDWLKPAGSPVKLDEAVVALETDKVNVDVPAPGAGTLTRNHRSPATRSGSRASPCAPQTRPRRRSG